GIRDYKVTGVQTCALPIFATIHYRISRLPVYCTPANLRARHLSYRGSRSWCAELSIWYRCAVGSYPPGGAEPASKAREISSRAIVCSRRPCQPRLCLNQRIERCHLAPDRLRRL